MYVNEATCVCIVQYNYIYIIDDGSRDCSKYTQSVVYYQLLPTSSSLCTSVNCGCVLLLHGTLCFVPFMLHVHMYQCCFRGGGGGS